MIDKMPLTRIAERCGIDVKTAFVWRHKILDALQNMMTRVILNGIAELDETYFRISYKGQKKGSFPGKARKRGKSRFKEGEGQGKKRESTSTITSFITIWLTSVLEVQHSRQML